MAYCFFFFHYKMNKREGERDICVAHLEQMQISSKLAETSLHSNITENDERAREELRYWIIFSEYDNLGAVVGQPYSQIIKWYKFWFRILYFWFMKRDIKRLLHASCLMHITNISLINQYNKLLRLRSCWNSQQFIMATIYISTYVHCANWECVSRWVKIHVHHTRTHTCTQTNAYKFSG